MMKLSEQIRKSMDDAEAGLPISWPIDHWANEAELLEAENEALREGLSGIRDLSRGHLDDAMRTRCLAAIAKLSDALLTGEKE